MSDLLNPVNLIVLAVIAVGMFFLDCVALPLRHTGRVAAAMVRTARRPKRLLWWIPMRHTIPIAMSCSSAA